MDLRGHSVAGIETCIEVPSLGLLLDIGRCTRTAVNQPIVLVSHGHLDHVGGAVQHAARRAMLGMSEGTYLVPASIAPDVERLFAAASVLDGGVIPHRVVPLAPGADFPLAKGRWIRPFETFHRVPSQGYTVWERRHRLRPQFRDLEGAALRELRRQGVVLDEDFDAPVLSFTGDTRVDILEKTAELGVVETLVMECTFIDDQVTIADARAMGHTHLEEIAARASLLHSRDVALTHFSARYGADQVRAAVARAFPAERGGTVRVLG